VATQRTRLLALESAALALFVLTLVTWFAGAPRAVPPGLALAALATVVSARAWMGGSRPTLPVPRAETLLCLVIAVAYRLPALLHPWGWVNRDGAYGAFVTLHLLQGARPAPVFTEGANYQGTLKSHLAALLALVSGARDLSFLMTAASLVLYLVFTASAMALARRVGGRAAALVTGLYLALGPRFLTVFSLNCVGQYVDVLALGGLALALLARVLDEDRRGEQARGHYLVLGLLIGAAFWQQPVALSCAAAVAAVLLFRAGTWGDAWTLLVPAGAALGALPVLLWNLQHGWASRDILGREPLELRAQAEALPHLVGRTLSVSFPILAGLSPNHPWADVPGVRAAAAWLLPLLLAAYVVLRRRELVAWARLWHATPAVLTPLLMVFCLALFWAVAAGSVYRRPRYLLPVVAASAVHAGVVCAWLLLRSRAAALGGLAALLALNVVGTVPRLQASATLARRHEEIVRSLEQKGIRTGYADFSISAPVTMFTSERILLSPALGPTPAYESEAHAREVAERGPDAYLLPPEDDPEQFASTLRDLGVGFRMETKPVTVFYSFSRRVRLEEVAGFRGQAREAAPPPEE
jgi:hypothetical protein